MSVRTNTVCRNKGWWPLRFETFSTSQKEVEHRGKNSEVQDIKGRWRERRKDRSWRKTYSSTNDVKVGQCLWRVPKGTEKALSCHRNSGNDTVNKGKISVPKILLRFLIMLTDLELLTQILIITLITILLIIADTYWRQVLWYVLCMRQFTDSSQPFKPLLFL